MKPDRSLGLASLATTTRDNKASRRVVTVTSSQGRLQRGAHETSAPVDDSWDVLGEQASSADADRVHSGQIRFAYRLAENFGDELMYVRGLGWFYWDSTRWVEDHTGRAERCVIESLRLAHIKGFGDSGLLSDMKKCESANGLRGVLEVASKLEKFAFTTDDLDRDPYLLNVANGTLDLQTMNLRKHDPTDRITKMCTASYVTDAVRGPWSRFLERSLPDPDVRSFLQRYVGQALVGRSLEHALVILTGEGRNGKGVWYKTINRALGSYAISVRPELLLDRDGAHTTDEMDLLGARWVVMSEIEKGRALADSTLKRLTGGDPIRARRMRQDSVQFEPSHSLAMVTNYLPKTGSEDEALWQRVKVVPFEVVIPISEQDPRLDEKLANDLDAVLSWAIQGWIDYQDQGLAPPDKVLNRTKDYRASTDGVGQFLEEQCDTGPNYRVGLNELWDEWQRWAGKSDFAQMAPTKREFGAVMQRRGFEQKNSGGRKWQGLQLKNT